MARHRNEGGWGGLDTVSPLGIGRLISICHVSVWEGLVESSSFIKENLRSIFFGTC